MRIPWVQQRLAQQAAQWLSSRLNTEVKVAGFSFSYLDEMSLKGVLLRDLNQDTLLYSAALNIKFTDWFFLKSEKELSYLGLEDALIYLHRPRTDSVWNYHFIEEAFAQDDKKDEDNATPEWAIRKVVLKNLRFLSKDEWVGEDHELQLSSLNIDIDAMSFANRAVVVDYIRALQPSYTLRDYKGGRPDSLRRQPSNTIDTTPFNPHMWQLRVNELDIQEGRFVMDDPDKAAGVPGLFYEWKMHVHPVHMHAEHISIEGDTLRANLTKLSAKDRSGIAIKSMRAKVRVSPKIAECSDLHLVTNNSVIQDYYAMHYERFPDFIDYISRVRMEARFKDAHVAMSDILFFAPEVKFMEQIQVNLSGNAGGTVASLHGDNLSVSDKNNMLRVKRFEMKGLPDVDAMHMQFEQSHITVGAEDLIAYIPQLIQGNELQWKALQQISGPFEMQGGMRELLVKTEISTALGALKFNGALSNLLADHPGYAGQLQLQAFNLGEFIGTTVLEEATGTLTLNGRGFDVNTLKLHVDGELQQLTSSHYPFQNVAITCTINENSLSANVRIADANAQLLFEGQMKGLNAEARGNFTADITYLNMQALSLLPEETILAGKLEGHFNGLSVDAMLGEAVLKHMQVQRAQNKLDIDSVYIKSLVEDDIRYLYLGSNNVAARLWGDYKIVELPQTLRYLLSKYLPAYYQPPVHFNRNQLVYFDIDAGNINDLISVVNPHVAVPAGAQIQGFYNAATDLLSMDAQLSRLVLNGFYFESLYIKGEGNQRAFELDAGAARLGYGANNMLDDLDIVAALANGQLDFTIKTATLDEFSKATLNGKGSFYEDGFEVNILPSYIYVNRNNWYIPAGNAIRYHKGDLSIAQLEISSDYQHIYVNRNPEEANTAYIELLGIGIAPAARLLGIDDVVSGGNINGTIAVSDLNISPVVAFDIQSDSVMVQGEPLQSLSVSGKYSYTDQMLVFNPGTGVFDKDGRLSISGTWAIGAGNKSQMDGLIAFDKAKVSWLSPVVKGYVSQLEGRLTGNVRLSGTPQNISTLGSVLLEQVSARPEVLGEKYTIEQGLLSFTGNKIALGRLMLRDAHFNTAQITGTITHKNLLEYDFDVQIESPKFKVLNLSAAERLRYYGNIDAQLNARVSGPATDIRLHTSLVPLENSSLVIPLDYSGDVGTYSYIKFKKPTDYQERWRARQSRNTTKYHVRIDALINNNLSTNIVMDSRTNDQLFSRGSGNIVMEIPSDGDVRLNGSYKIESGYYNFAFRQLQVINYNREFTLVPGSTIVWSGDIYDAHLNVTGYTTVKARLYDLISNEVNKINISEQDLRDAQQPQIINVKLKAGNTLQNPEVDFKIELAENRSIGTYAYQKLERVNGDETQLLNQVASLLLLDQFAPPEGFMNNTVAVSSGALNNVSDVLSSVASSQLSNWANKLFGVNDLHVGLRYKNYNLNNSLNSGATDFLNRNEAKLTVRKNFLNNRLMVDVGGVYDWGRPAQLSGGAAYSSNLAGDFMAQYLIRRDGRLRFTIFRNSNYDALFQQNIARQGVGLSYRKSFNNIWELLGIKTKADAPAKAGMPAADSLDAFVLPPVGDSL